jgi:coenzyme PQQ precursor peptide PqqA
LAAQPWTVRPKEPVGGHSHENRDPKINVSTKALPSFLADSMERGRQFASSLVKPAEHVMTWTTPAFCDIRFGFEITMYIANR